MKDDQVKPAGLGARDLLRLDVGYLLYGNDMDEQTTPLEAGAEWVVAWNKDLFQGKPALLKQKEQGLTRSLVGFEMNGTREFPRHDMEILKDGASYWKSHQWKFFSHFTKRHWIRVASPSPMYGRDLDRN